MPSTPLWSDRTGSAAPRIPIQVFWVPPGSPTFVWFLGDLVGVETHWHERPSGRAQTVPCIEGWCPFHEAGDPVRWKAYAAAMRFVRCKRDGTSGWQAIAIDLPTAAAEGLAKVQEEWGTLRGLVFEFEREGKHANSPLLWKFHEDAREKLTAPAFDVKVVLTRMWRQWLELGNRAGHRPAQIADLIPYPSKADRKAAEGGAS